MVVFETLKVSLISAHVLEIPIISSQEAEFIAPTDASKAGIAGLLL